MLFNIIVPGSAGALPTEGNNPSNNSVTLNGGNMTNKGIEMTLGTIGKVAGIGYRINGTFTKNRNEITKINGNTTFQLNSASALISGDGSSLTTALSVGHEAGAFFLFETGGIADTQEKLAAYRVHQPTAELGDLIIKDVNQDEHLDVLVVGNSYSSDVATGRYDAFTGAVMLGDGQGSFDIKTGAESGFWVNTDARCIATLRLANQDDIILVGSNSGYLKIFKK